MKKNPASIEDSANAEAKKKADANAHAAGIIFHSKPPAKQTNKGNTMKAKRTPYAATEENADFLACRVLAVDATGRRYAFNANVYEAERAEEICKGINNRKTYGESQEFIPVNAIPDMADIEKLMKCLLYIEKSLTLAGDPPALACQSYQLEKTREAISFCMKLGAIG